MGLFTKRPVQLPTTSYGYTPPPEATAQGWQCNNEDCGTGDVPAPRSWPFRCPQCGGPADPAFDQPWREEARGPRLQMLLDRDIRDGRTGATSVYEAGIGEWKYGRALMKGDIAGAEEIRRQLSDWLSQPEQDYSRPSTYGMIVMHALESGQTAAAADQLRSWIAYADTSDLANSNDKRVNCFSLLRNQLRFLEDPRGALDPAAPQIAADARALGAAIRPELPLDLEQQWRRLR